MHAVGVIALIAIIEAAIAAACLPWLPKHADGPLDVLIFAGVYMSVFFGAIAAFDWWGRHHNSQRRKRVDSPRPNA